MGNDRVIVEGVNMITKYERKTQENPEGSSIQREASIHYSNVMLTEKFDAKAESKK
jgi:large subunit ribosomal protein L24